MGDASVILDGGGEKPAREVAAGDRLVGRNPSGGPLRAQEVVVLVRMDQPALRIVHERGSFECSDSHLLVLASGAVLPARCLEPGADALQDEAGELVAVLRVEALGEAEVYGWTCLPDHAFFAGGILHHNKTMIDDPVILQ